MRWQPKLDLRRFVCAGHTKRFVRVSTRTRASHGSGARATAVRSLPPLCLVSASEKNQWPLEQFSEGGALLRSVTGGLGHPANLPYMYALVQRPYLVRTGDAVDDDAGDTEEEENHAGHEEQPAAHREVELGLHREDGDGDADCRGDTHGNQYDVSVVVTAGGKKNSALTSVKTARQWGGGERGGVSPRHTTTTAEWLTQAVLFATARGLKVLTLRKLLSRSTGSWELLRETLSEFCAGIFCCCQYIFNPGVLSSVRRFSNVLLFAWEPPKQSDFPTHLVIVPVIYENAAVYKKKNHGYWGTPCREMKCSDSGVGAFSELRGSKLRSHLTYSLL